VTDVNLTITLKERGLKAVKQTEKKRGATELLIQPTAGGLPVLRREEERKKHIR